MTGFFMFLHGAVAIFLIVIILMQSGRGGGLTESFASAESLFGAKTNEFMIKATTVFATLFLVTCLGLAVVSSQKGKSLMADQVIPAGQVPVEQPIEDAVNETSSQLKVMEEKAVSTEPIPEAFSDMPSEGVSVTVTPEAK